MKIFLYLLPLPLWVVAVLVLGRPRDFNEFVFAGHWLLIPLAFFYGPWIALVQWLMGKLKQYRGW